ncbi:MAG: pyruvate kinase [Actinomycetota bacterium]
MSPAASGAEGLDAPRTKLMCTLGPATSGVDAVVRLAEAGADIFRVNFSHGSDDEHRRAVDDVRGAEERIGRPLAVLADLPGPKVRLGKLRGEKVQLKQGSAFELRPGGGSSGHVPDEEGDERGAVVGYDGLAHDLEVGDRILLADGAVELRVASIDGDVVSTEVVRSGKVGSGQGVNVPAEKLGLPAVTDRDRAGLELALDTGVDGLLQSFVRAASDVQELRDLMGRHPLPIMAKIETAPAITAYDDILAWAEGIMVARGDLGVELPMEEIPILQKELIGRARGRGVPAVVATQMLESMQHSQQPTRAEANDVANAVLDGADAVMLSAETAVGEYPVEAAEAATRIAAYAEQRGREFLLARPDCRHQDQAAAIAHAAADVVARHPDVVAIACYTRSGGTPRLLAMERPGVPIFVLVPDERVRRRLCVIWGVQPLPAEMPQNTDEMIEHMDRALVDRDLAKDGQPVVMVAPAPLGRAHTNLLKIHRLGSPAD